jgi:hypothetical protein
MNASTSTEASGMAVMSHLASGCLLARPGTTEHSKEQEAQSRPMSEALDDISVCMIGGVAYKPAGLLCN